MKIKLSLVEGKNKGGRTKLMWIKSYKQAKLNLEIRYDTDFLIETELMRNPGYPPLQTG